MMYLTRYVLWLFGTPFFLRLVLSGNPGNIPECWTPARADLLAMGVCALVLFTFAGA